MNATGRSLSRFTLTVTVVAAIGCGVGTGSDQRQRSTASEVAAPDPPALVVFYVFDALRADHVGGRGWTPILDRMVEEGVSFTEYTSSAASTMTWAKILFAGRFFLERGGLPETEETLAEVVRAAGYHTVGLSGNGHISAQFGLDRGFDTFEMVWPLARGADPATYVNRNAEDLHRRAIELLDSHPTGSPVFLYIHSIHPHTPYAPPHDLAEELCGGIPSVIDGMSPTLLEIRDQEVAASPADRRRLACLYGASLRYNDTELGRFLSELDARYSPGEVLIIVTSDHGEEFFDHGGVLHGHTLYDELLRVPLIVHWPGIVEPSTANVAADTIDLHQTVRALVGASRATGGGGRSLWPAILGQPDPNGEQMLRFAAVPTLPGGMTMVRSATHKLILAPRTDGGPGMGLGLGRSRDPEYLFDLTRDPGETRNLIGSGVTAEPMLRAELAEWMERTSAGRPAVVVDLDRATREHLEALGYVE